jgi:protease-4
MNRALKWVMIGGGLIAALALILVVSAMISGRIGGDRVLLVTIDGDLRESPDSNPFAALEGGHTPTLRTVTEGIRRAATDGRIVGLVLDIEDVAPPLAQIEEIEAAMAVFRESGKWSLSFLETAGEFARGNAAYALAVCADEVVLAPPGDINLIGMQASVPFVKGTLDRLKLQARFEQRHEYKNAANIFTQEALTPEHREATVALVDDLAQELVDHLAARRGVEDAHVRGWIEGGPYTAEAALEAGLVDRLAYADEIQTEVEEKLDKDDPFLGLARYAGTGDLHESGPTVALIYADGNIARGDSGDNVAGSDTVARALRTAREEEVKGVLLRVNSPGGSYIASDLIRREVAVTRKAGIPVVVAMGGLAASGGYFISMEADRIVAQPSSITGSIGVYAGSFGAREVWRHWLGVTFDSYETADNADLYSWLDLPDETEQTKISEFADRIYDDFVSKVARGRSLERARVEEIARGRVWSGRRALELGLVDILGGVEVAVAELKKLMSVEPHDDIQFRVIPRPKTAFEVLEEVFGEVSQVATWSRRGARWLQTRTGVLRMPLEIEVQ